MKVICLAVALTLHLSSVLGQNLQGGESVLHRQLEERMEAAPFEQQPTQEFRRTLLNKIKKYGSEFLPAAYTGFCRSPGNKHGHYKTYYGWSEDDCMKKCAAYNTFHKHGLGAVCTAYEYHAHKKKCEIHFERIVDVAPSDDPIRCVGANDVGCTIGSYFETYFSHGNPGFSYCRVGKTKGEYHICHECKTLYKCFEKCKEDEHCLAFEFSESNGGKCEIHTKRPTGVVKTKKKGFCYVKRDQFFDACD